MNALRLRQLLRELFRRSAEPDPLLLRVLRASDPDLAAHAARTKALLGVLAPLLGPPELELAPLGLGALLHDLGKVLLPRDLLRAPRPLTEPEREIVRSHPLLAVRLLVDVALPEATLDGIAHHHERWDGSGYPFGLGGPRIPKAARLLAIVDVYDTLTHPRPYAATFRPEEALAILRREAGSHFDPDLLDRVLPLLETAFLDDTAGDRRPLFSGGLACPDISSPALPSSSSPAGLAPRAPVSRTRRCSSRRRARRP